MCPASLPGRCLVFVGAGVCRLALPRPRPLLPPPRLCCLRRSRCSGGCVRDCPLGLAALAANSNNNSNINNTATYTNYKSYNNYYHKTLLLLQALLEFAMEERGGLAKLYTYT